MTGMWLATREQVATLDELCAEHGNLEVGMSRSTAGLLAIGHCKDGFEFAVDEDGRLQQGSYPNGGPR